MIKINKRKDKSEIMINGDEPTILTELKMIIDAVYEKMSPAGKKTILDGWESLFNPKNNKKQVVKNETEKLLKRIEEMEKKGIEIPSFIKEMTLKIKEELINKIDDDDDDYIEEDIEEIDEEEDEEEEDIKVVKCKVNKKTFDEIAKLLGIED